MPDGSGTDQSAPGAPFLTDSDGDVANEFWEEDAAGNLIKIFPGERSAPALEEEEEEEEDKKDEKEEKEKFRGAPEARMVKVEEG